ncbi:MAG TPA: RNA polymerase sigma factor SigJ [Streptosporangiaceae bacterium]|nr:RNA polymerase sigma factor SigJ [Streptosporangiaceae bacterium]
MSPDPFEAARPRIRGLAYRMLGTLADAEDVTQDIWLRWQAAGGAHVANAEAWLVTAATRLCLDRLRSAARTREIYPGPWLPEPIVTDPGPESAAELSESLTLGFLVLLDQLTPVERAVFVLADVFKVPYAEIAATVGRSPAACRQIASRARRRLRPEQPPGPAAAADRELVDGLLRALASGDVNEVVARLAPQVVCLTDGGPGRRAARRPVTGPDRVARFLVGLARGYGRHLATRPAVVGGAAGAILSSDGVTEQVMAVTSRDGVITAIYFVGNPDKLTPAGRLPLLE